MVVERFRDHLVEDENSPFRMWATMVIGLISCLGLGLNGVLVIQGVVRMEQHLQLPEWGIPVLNVAIQLYGVGMVLIMAYIVAYIIANTYEAKEGSKNA